MKSAFLRGIIFLKTIFENIRTAYRRDYMKIISVFLFFLISFSYIYFYTDKFTSLDDQFFSIRYAEILKEKGPGAFLDFPWLHFSKIAENKQLFSYNFLFYIVLIPFTLVKPLFLGIKLYGVIFASLSYTALYFFFLKIKIRKSFFWIFLLFAITSMSYNWKLMMMRSFTIAPALLLMEIYLLHRKKYWGIFAISIFYFFWHTTTFFFPLMVACLYFAFENLYKRKFDWKIILSCVSGLAVSFLFIAIATPFSSFVNFFSTSLGIFGDILLGKKVNIAQGMELSPVNVLDFIKTYTFVSTLFILAAVFEIYNYIENRKKIKDIPDDANTGRLIIRGVLFFLGMLFLLGSFLSGRNVDFFVYFSFAYIALSFNFFISSVRWQDNLVKKSLRTGLLVVAIYFFVGNILDNKIKISQTEPHDAIEGTAQWLKNNSKKGEVIFNPTMNWFPTLFYYDTDNYYIVGAEPKLLYDYNPKLYWAWSNISTKGYFCLTEGCSDLEEEKQMVLRKDDQAKEWYEKQGNLTADFIKTYFRSRFVITSKEFQNLNKVLDNSGRFKKAYTDTVYNKFFVYEIN